MVYHHQSAVLTQHVRTHHRKTSKDSAGPLRSDSKEEHEDFDEATQLNEATMQLVEKAKDRSRGANDYLHSGRVFFLSLACLVALAPLVLFEAGIVHVEWIDENGSTVEREKLKSSENKQTHSLPSLPSTENTPSRKGKNPAKHDSKKKAHEDDTSKKRSHQLEKDDEHDSKKKAHEHDTSKKSAHQPEKDDEHDSKKKAHEHDTSKKSTHQPEKDDEHDSKKTQRREKKKRKLR